MIHNATKCKMQDTCPRFSPPSTHSGPRPTPRPAHSRFSSSSSSTWAARSACIQCCPAPVCVCTCAIHTVCTCICVQYRQCTYAFVCGRMWAHARVCVCVQACACDSRACERSRSKQARRYKHKRAPQETQLCRRTLKYYKYMCILML